MKKYELIQQRIGDIETVEWPPELRENEAKFALNTIQGYGPQQAYKKAYGVSAKGMTPNQLSKAANKVKNRPAVKKYIRALMAELERVAIANSLDIQMFLTAVVFTDVGSINEHSILCQKKTTTTTTHKDGSETTNVKVEMPDKHACLKTLSRIKGLDAPIKIDHNHKHQVSGVMVVPMATNAEEWEKLAAGSQKQLVEDALLID